MQVFKWGDDLAVQLPENLVEEMGLKSGDELEIVDVVERTLLVHKQDRQEAAYKFDPDEANEQ